MKPGTGSSPFSLRWSGVSGTRPLLIRGTGRPGTWIWERPLRLCGAAVGDGARCRPPPEALLPSARRKDVSTRSPQWLRRHHTLPQPRSCPGLQFLQEPLWHVEAQSLALACRLRWPSLNSDAALRTSGPDARGQAGPLKFILPYYSQHPQCWDRASLRTFYLLWLLTSFRAPVSHQCFLCLHSKLPTQKQVRVCF